MTYLTIQSLQEVWEHLDANTLLVADLDNTLIECSTQFGSYQWAAYLIRRAVDQGKSLLEALEEVVPRWENLQHLVEVVPIEEEAPRWIEAYQKRGQKIIGLTGRSFTLATRTLAELKRLGLSFSHLSLEKAFFSEQMPQVLHQEGIIFVGPNQNKGEVLKAVLKQLEHSFEKIVFLDDQKRYVDQVQKALEPLDLDFVGLHFTALDQKVAAFDYAKALEEEKQMNLNSSV